MGFLNKLFTRGTIIRSKKCIHLKTGNDVGAHFGIVEESNKEDTLFHIFTHSTEGSNKPIETDKFSNDFAKENLDDSTNISEALFKNKTKKIKRVKGGGKYDL